MADSQTLRLKHLVAIRWFHWINFPLLAMMIWSGILIYWAYSPYHIFSVHIFPEWFVDALNIKFRLAEGMALHFFFMWLFITNGILYVGYTLLSGEWRLLVPRSFSAFRDAWFVLLHDLHLRKEVPAQDKYNAAQQIAYTAIHRPWAWVRFSPGSLFISLCKSRGSRRCSAATRLPGSSTSCSRSATAGFLSSTFNRWCWQVGITSAAW